MQFTVLEEKFVGRAVHEGLLTALSELEAHVQSTVTPAVLSNVKLTVGAGPLDNPGGEIYGKVVDGGGVEAAVARVRFTSVTPELKAWVVAAATA